MQLSLFQKIILGVSGTTALAIGSFILLAPHGFYASYGITLGHNANLLSELRAPGAGLTAFGAIMLAGLLRAAVTSVAIAAALAVYLAFPVGRVVSIAVDGVPSGSVLGALAIEIVIAGLLLAAFGRRRAETSGNASVVDLPG